MSGSSLLQPPPQDLTDLLRVRQWMHNTYQYLYQKSITDSARIENINSSLEDINIINALVPISSGSFTEVSNYTVPSCFTEDYLTYVLFLTDVYNTTGGKLLLQLYGDDTIDTRSVYLTSNIYASAAVVTSEATQTTGFDISSTQLLGTTTSTKACCTVNLLKVRATSGQVFIETTVGRAITSSNLLQVRGTGVIDSPGYAYNGFNLTTNTGTINGSYIVYGLASH